jgi:DNA-binding response OmpR family regulator
MRILVIEDDQPIRHGILFSLRYNGFETLEAPDGKKGLELALGEEYDLLLLDLVLPGTDGLEILRQVRARSSRVPVIILTARGDEEDRVKGLKLGADDYVVKPFSVKELLARIEAVLRRSPERPPETALVAVPGGTVNVPNREAIFKDGERMVLSEREADLLGYLASHAGQAISRSELLSRVWHVNPKAVETRTVDVHIAKLREKLRDNLDDPKLIATVWGKGYRYTPPEGEP